MRTGFARLKTQAAMIVTISLTAIAPSAAHAKNDAAAIEKRMFALHQAGKDDAALAEAEQLVRVVERDRNFGKDVVANAICNMAFCALCARQPKKALAASERALQIAPQYLLCHKDRAHALLFLGRTNEARSIYLAHKGDWVGGRRWEAFVSQDFREFKTRGIDHPLRAEIEQALASAPNRAQPKARATKSRVDAEMECRDLCFASSLVCRPGCSDFSSWAAAQDCRLRCNAQEKDCLGQCADIARMGAR